MTKYDLVAIDIDGTLINSAHNITKPVAEAIQKVIASGTRIVLCTGRPYPGAKRYMNELGLTQEGDYIINYHGALVQRTDSEQVVINHQLNHEDLLRWHDFAKTHAVNFQGVRGDSVYAEQLDFSPKSLIEPFVNSMYLRIRKFADLDPELKYSKFVLQDEVAMLDALEKDLPVSFWDDYTIIRSMDDSIEVLNKDASKGRTLRELAEHLNIPRERVMAIGDSGNDIDMIDYAGLGVAMGNAVPEVLAVADVVTSTNDEDGVALALNQYFFSE